MVSVMIFTLNEALHLPHCLASLQWCDDVIIVDSFSSDATQAIAEQAGARFVQHEFTGFGDQRNWALDHAQPKHDWVLILDADERVPDELAEEILAIAQQPDSDHGAYRLRRRFYMWGRWLRYSSLYPTWVVRLIHRERVRYINRGHAETQEVQGQIGSLEHDLIDQNLKGIDEWYERQNRYSRKDVEYELKQAQGQGLGGGSLWQGAMGRRVLLKRLAAHLPFRSFWYFIYVYVLRLGFLDGRDGLMFCRMRAVHQTMIETKKYDHFRNPEASE